MTPRQARLTLASVMLVTLLGTAGVALPYPILAPLFLGETPSAVTRFLGLHPKLLLGLILALYPLGILVGSSFIGALSDRYGRRRVLVITLLLSALGYVLTAFAVLAGTFALFAAARLWTGLCEGNISVARAIATDLHPVVDRTRALSLVYAVTYAGWLVGPLAGGYLMPFGAEIAFLVAAAAIGGSAFAVRVLLEGSTSAPGPATAGFAGPEEPGRSASPGLASLWGEALRRNSLGLLRERPIRGLFFFHLLFTLGLNAYYEFYPVWLVESFSFDSRRIALGTVVITSSMIVTSTLFVTRLAQIFGTRRAVGTSVATFTLLLALLPWLRSEALVFLVFAAQGAVIAVHNGTFSAFMSGSFGERGQGRVLGLLVTTFCLANVLIALVGSALSLFGGEWALVGGAVFTAAATALFVRLPLARSPSPEVRPATV
jgi:MFS family permease